MSNKNIIKFPDEKRRKCIEAYKLAMEMTRKRNLSNMGARIVRTTHK